MVGKVKKTLLIMFLILISSCVTNEIQRDISLDDLVVNEINEGLNNSELFKVYQLLTYYETQRDDTTFLDSSRETLNELLPLQLKKLQENKSWIDFFITYNNLKTLGFDLNEYDYNKIFYKYIVDNISSTLFKSGVLLGESTLNYSVLTNDEIIVLKELYQDVTFESDYPKIKDEFLNRQLVWDTEDKGNYIDGVMTIYVDKGISFQGGLGRQDIVIGSGFFIDKLGHAITNFHVIEPLVDPTYEGVSNLYIKLNGESEKIPAKVIGWDPILDLALIKISTIPSYAYTLSEDDNLDIGDKVVAIGSPGGLGSTVTSGIVSATDRTFLELGSVIQIDSPINPGNSGGPLINDSYEVNNVVFAGIENFEGVNFAIPGKYLKKSLPSLYRGGEISHVWLGAGITYRKKQLEINYIKPNSPAFYLDLQKGDIIKSINNITFDSVIDIQNYLMDFSPNEIINIRYLRKDVELENKICLDSRPEVAMNTILEGDTSDNLYIPLFGMDIKFTGKILWDKEYLINDIYPGTIADELSLKPGDIIKVKNWEYNKEFNVVFLQFVIQSQKEGFWEKTIQVAAPINVNVFI